MADQLPRLKAFNEKMKDIDRSLSPLATDEDSGGAKGIDDTPKPASAISLPAQKTSPGMRPHSNASRRFSAGFSQ